MPSTPEVKTLKPITFLFHRMKISIPELEQAIPVGQQLIREAVNYNLFITGCIHWHYFDFTGNETEPFMLEVALPVAKPDSYAGQFAIKTTSDFKCVCLTHEGAWNEIPKSYGHIMEFMKTNQLNPANEGREVYVNADFANQAANVTEIQLGIS